MSVGEICKRTVVIAYSSMVLSEAARLMRDEHVSCLIVVKEADEGRIPVGILTDRDIVLNVVAKDLDAMTIAVGQVMNTNLVTAREDDTVFDVLRMMGSRAIRHVPVTGQGGRLVGILALDDLLVILTDELRDVVLALARIQAHEAPPLP